MNCIACGTTAALVTAWTPDGHIVVCKQCRNEGTRQCRAATNALGRCRNGAYQADTCRHHQGWPVQDWYVCEVCGQDRLPEFCHRCAARQRMALFP